MKIILLSGGSGKHLWPLSNDARSKQFLKLFKAPDGSSESLVQRFSRQIRESEINFEITAATSVSQYDSIVSQLGTDVVVVTEPERRNTFPAIALSSAHLIYEQGCSLDEVVVVVPCDTYVDASYFECIAKIAEAVEQQRAEIILMGIEPTEASSKYGYALPRRTQDGENLHTVESFTEKPSTAQAAQLIEQGALWSAGLFAFKLSYISQIIEQHITVDSFEELRSRYMELPKISFDYEVVEKATSIGIIKYGGQWCDIGTWDALSKKIPASNIGNVILSEDAKDTLVISELDTPIVCMGTKDIIVAASPDGILVSDRKAADNLKAYSSHFISRPMYEERRWGTYRVMGHEHFADGHNALTKLLHLNAGCSISYQYHNLREEIWTFVDGKALLLLDGEIIEASRGYVAHIKAGQKHAVKAISDVQIIEVQAGTDLIEEDIIRLDWEWK